MVQHRAARRATLRHVVAQPIGAVLVVHLPASRIRYDTSQMGERATLCEPILSMPMKVRTPASMRGAPLSPWKRPRKRVRGQPPPHRGPRRRRGRAAGRAGPRLSAGAARGQGCGERQTPPEGACAPGEICGGERRRVGKEHSGAGGLLAAVRLNHVQKDREASRRCAYRWRRSVERSSQQGMNGPVRTTSPGAAAEPLAAPAVAPSATGRPKISAGRRSILPRACVESGKAGRLAAAEQRAQTCMDRSGMRGSGTPTQL